MRRTLRWFWERCVLNPITIGVAALILLLVSTALISVGAESSALLARLRALPRADAASLRSNIGQEVLVEGQIAAHSARGMGELAAYVVVERRSRRFDLVQERSTPALELETTTGPLRLASTAYELPYPYRAVALGRRGLRGGQLWAYGVAPGDTVVVIGQVGEAGGQPALTAEQIVLGSAEGYHAYLEGQQRIGWWAGVPLLLGALGLLVLLARQIASYVRHDRELARQLQQELEQQQEQREQRARERKTRRRQRGEARAGQPPNRAPQRRKQRP